MKIVTSVGLLLAILGTATLIGYKMKAKARVASAEVTNVQSTSASCALPGGTNSSGSCSDCGSSEASATDKKTVAPACGCGTEPAIKSTEATTNSNRNGSTSKVQGCSESSYRHPIEDAVCGPTALYIVLSALGVKTTVSELIKLSTSVRGGQSSMLDLSKAASAKGCQTAGLRISYEELTKTKLPVVAWLKEGHFVSIIHCDKAAVILGGDKDPRVVRRTKKQDFLRIWSGEILQVDRK